MHARGIEHQSKGVRELLGGDQHRAGHRATSAAKARLRHDHRPGQRPGRPRARAEVRSAARPARASPIPSTARARRRRLGHRAGRAAAARAARRVRDHGSDPQRRDQGRCSRSASTRWSRCRTPTSPARRSRSSSSSASIDFFLSETARHADVVLAGSLQEEEEGRHRSAEGRVIQINKAVDPPGDARADSAHHLRPGAAVWARGKYFPFREPREIFEELRRGLARAASPTTTASPTRRSTQQMGVFWPCPTLDHPGTPRLFEGGRFFHPDGKARFHGRRVARERRSGGRRRSRSILTTGPRGQPVPLGHADAPHRRAGRSVSRAAARDASAAGGAARHRRRRLGDRRDAPRRDHAAGDGGAHDPARHGLHPLPLAGRPQRQPADPSHARSAQQDSRSSRSAACRVAQGGRPPEYAAALEPQQ